MAEEQTPWGKAMFSALEANGRADNDRPSNWYALGSALARDQRSTQTASSWRGMIKRIRKGNPPLEAKAMMIADALGVERSSLPPSHQRLTLTRLADELADAMRHIAKLETRVESLEGRRSQREASPTLTP